MVNHEDGGEHDKHGWVKVPSNEVIEVEIWILFTVVNPFPGRSKISSLLGTWTIRSTTCVERARSSVFIRTVVNLKNSTKNAD